VAIIPANEQRMVVRGCVNVRFEAGEALLVTVDKIYYLILPLIILITIIS